MADKVCPHAATCEMYDLFRLKTALRVWQINFCESDYTRCARYQESCQARAVPKNLLPNGKMLTIPEEK